MAHECCPRLWSDVRSTRSSMQHSRTAAHDSEVLPAPKRSLGPVHDRRVAERVQVLGRPQLLYPRKLCFQPFVWLSCEQSSQETVCTGFDVLRSALPCIGKTRQQGQRILCGRDSAAIGNQCSNAINNEVEYENWTDIDEMRLLI
jgi:hypothetical protein